MYKMHMIRCERLSMRDSRRGKTNMKAWRLAGYSHHFSFRSARMPRLGEGTRLGRSSSEASHTHTYIYIWYFALLLYTLFRRRRPPPLSLLRRGFFSTCFVFVCVSLNDTLHWTIMFACLYSMFYLWQQLKMIAGKKQLISHILHTFTIQYIH